MTPEQAVMDARTPEDLDWDAVYADQAPRVYNYFRFRLGREADVEELTSRTFESMAIACELPTRPGRILHLALQNRAKRPNRLPSITT